MGHISLETETPLILNATPWARTPSPQEHGGSHMPPLFPGEHVVSIYYTLGTALTFLN